MVVEIEAQLRAEREHRMDHLPLDKRIHTTEAFIKRQQIRIEGLDERMANAKQAIKEMQTERQNLSLEAAKSRRKLQQWRAEAQQHSAGAADGDMHIILQALGQAAQQSQVAAAITSLMNACGGTTRNAPQPPSGCGPNIGGDAGQAGGAAGTTLHSVPESSEDEDGMTDGAQETSAAEGGLGARQFCMHTPPTPRRHGSSTPRGMTPSDLSRSRSRGDSAGERTRPASTRAGLRSHPKVPSPPAGRRPRRTASMAPFGGRRAGFCQASNEESDL